MSAIRIALGTLIAAGPLVASPACAQQTDDPFPDPIAASEGAIVVGVSDYATIPDIDGEPPRLMHLVPEPGTDRVIVSDMRGLLYRVGAGGSSVEVYLDLRESRWDVEVAAGSRERGLQSFAFHPQFHESGTEGYGRFYTWVDSNDMGPDAEFTSPADDPSHHTVLLEWTANDPTAASYDGGPPRTLFRAEQPYGNHNGGAIGFNPLAEPGDPDFGMLYVGVGDGGSGGDPMDLAQNPRSLFGKILRLDPTGSNSDNGEYGIPADNPFVDDAATLNEIYALGLRNPQRFAWDPANGNMFASDIGQNIIEKLSLVPSGGNLGWNDWEGSFGFVSRTAVDVSNPRGDPSVTYPVSEYDQLDPLLQPSSAASGLHVYRQGPIEPLQGLVLWGDFPSGEIFYVSADDLPEGGQDSIRRILLDDGDGPRTFLEIIRDRNESQGRAPATRADMRLSGGPNGEVFLLNKADGLLRVLAP